MVKMSSQQDKSPSDSFTNSNSVSRRAVKYDSSDSDSDDCVQWIEESDTPVSDIEENTNDWDNDCIVIEPENTLQSLCGYERASKNDAQPPKKKSKINDELSINKSLSAEVLFEYWTQIKPYEAKNIELLAYPFQLFVIKHFITNPFVLNAIRDEANTLKWNRRRLDLYEFFQTDDLCNTESMYLKKLYNFLATDVMPWVSKATGLPLMRVSASCSFYAHTDHLLVHDDLQGDRCVAFILYLTGVDRDSHQDIWKPEYGGALQLFDKDEAEQPHNCVKNFFPSHNQFVFFQVKRDSYHQVAEVITMDHYRLSINGWFHTDKIPLEEAPRLPTPAHGVFSSEFFAPIDIPECYLEDWIEPMYLEIETKLSINIHIEDSCEISLPNYFVKDKIDRVFNAITDEQVSWIWEGPPNRRHYQIALEKSLPTEAQEFLQLFKSNLMFSLMKSYTELDLVPGANMNPKVRYELQKWMPGSYSLMSETGWFTDCELDVILYFGCTDFGEKNNAGQIMYVARGDNEQEALITLVPKNNTLNLIYREEDTARIMPHIPHRCQNQIFYALVCSYKQ